MKPIIALLVVIQHICKEARVKIGLLLFQKKWRKINKNNFTIAGSAFDPKVVSVGKYSYGTLNMHSYNPMVEKVIIGNFVSIAEDVVFIMSGNHNIGCFSTYPYKTKIIDSHMNEAKSRGPIIIEDDVWIGCRATILSGVTIGKGAIIGAGSVVAKNIEPFSIYAGNPARKIGERFSDIRVKKIMMNIDYSMITKEFILKHIDFLYKDLTYEVLCSLFPELCPFRT